jgi:ABC-type uncharacterized transport system ATPase subunit
MIHSLQFLNGFPTQWGHIGNRVFHFSPDVNFIYGQNGVGKSVIAKTLAAYCGIDKGGWTRISEPAKLASKLQNHFPWIYRQYTPNHIDAKVVWDGTPTFYYDSELMGKNDMTWFFQNASQSADGITTEAEQMDILTTKPSSGQYRIAKINKVMQLIKSPPNLSVIPPDIVANERQYAQLEINYIHSLPRNGKMTLILDEPERGLVLPRQLDLFDNVSKTLAKYFQVIIISHSPFALFHEDANLIDVEPGYSESCRKLVYDYVMPKKKKK